MENKYTDQELMQLLKQNMAESELIEKKIQNTYDIIRKGDEKNNRTVKRRKLGKMPTAIAGAVTILLTAVCVFAANPVLAAKIPIIGRIFQIEEEQVSYHGDYSNNANILLTNEQTMTDEVDSLYRQTSNGFTVTISECYADSISMYLAITLLAENGFPQEIMDTAKNTELTYETLEMDTTAIADFSESGLGKIFFDPAYGIESPYIIEGHFIDNETFAGIIRIDLTDFVAQQEDGTLTDISSVPAHFTYHLNIHNIYANEDIEGHRNNEITKISGNWNFTINIMIDNSQSIIKNVNLTNSNGIGIGSIKKTPYEIEAELTLPSKLNPADYIIIMADENGVPLHSRGGTNETYDIYKRNINKVIIGICDDTTFMDYKGDFKTLLSKSIFQTEVIFTE